MRKWELVVWSTFIWVSYEKPNSYTVRCHISGKGCWRKLKLITFGSKRVDIHRLLNCAPSFFRSSLPWPWPPVTILGIFLLRQRITADSRAQVSTLLPCTMQAWEQSLCNISSQMVSVGGNAVELEDRTMGCSLHDNRLHCSAVIFFCRWNTLTVKSWHT